MILMGSVSISYAQKIDLNKICKKTNKKLIISKAGMFLKIELLKCIPGDIVAARTNVPLDIKTLQLVDRITKKWAKHNKIKKLSMTYLTTTKVEKKDNNIHYLYQLS